MSQIDDKKLACFEDLLINMRKEVLKESLHKRLKEVDEGYEEAKDVYDIASDERGKDLSLLLSDRDQEKIEAINEALLRIKNKTYGICIECGKDIPEGRLKIMPFTDLCVECKEDLEREDQARPFTHAEKYARSFDLNDTKEEE